MRYKFPPSFTPYASTTTVNSYHTALERPALRRPSPLTRSSHDIPRSLSSGSVADNRFYPCSFPPERKTSSSNLSSRQNSIASLSQAASQRPGSTYSRPVSARSDDWRISPSQRDPLYIEMSSQSRVDVTFVFPSNPEPLTTVGSLSSQPHSRATSVHSFRSNNDRPVIIRSASVIQRSHIDQSHRKVPLFVPKSIEKHSISDGEEQTSLAGRRDSQLSGTEAAAYGSDRLNSRKSEVSNWSMSYQEGAVGHESIDLESDSATIRPIKHGPLNDIMNHFSNRKQPAKNTMKETDDSIHDHNSFAKDCGSCVRRLSRAFKSKSPDDLTSSSRENLHPRALGET